MLKLTDIRYTPPFHINYNSSMDYIRDLAENKYNDVIDFEVYLPTKGKNLQRPLVWTLFQKQQLIFSLLKGIKIAPLSLIQYKSGPADSHVTLKVVDGKQRLSTILSFYKNEFPIEWEGVEYYFNDLDAEGKRAIALLNLTASVAFEYEDSPISDDEKIKWFEMINFSGTPQDEEHLKSLKS